MLLLQKDNFNIIAKLYIDELIFIPLRVFFCLNVYFRSISLGRHEISEAFKYYTRFC